MHCDRVYLNAIEKVETPASVPLGVLWTGSFEPYPL